MVNKVCLAVAEFGMANRASSYYFVIQKERVVSLRDEKILLKPFSKRPGSEAYSDP